MQNFYFKVVLRYSRKSCYLFLLLLMSVSVSAMSQTMNDVRISMKVSQIPLKEIFTQIEKRSGFIIGYDNDLDVNERFTIDVIDRPVSEVLHSLLKNYHEKLSQIDEKRILIKVTKKADSVVPVAKDHIITGSVIIRGNVTDDLGNPLYGVSAGVKGTSIGTQTDAQGNYSINAPDDNVTVVFSYIGFESQEVRPHGNTTINIRLKANSNSLNEVVIVGYGVMKKSSLTGAVSKIDSKTLNTLPTSNVIEALQGKITGVQIGAETTPGSTPSILIRGTRSLKASNSPLYVVDGIPLSPGSTLSDIALSDVESVEVLKDAASTAIYGSRGANGVIIVTTKRGRPNQPTEISFNTYYGENQAQIPPLMNGPQYVQLRRDVSRMQKGWDKGYPDDKIIFYPNELKTIASGDYTNWQDLLFRNGKNQSYNVNVAHGSDKAQVFMSLGYLDQQGYYKTGDNQRINMTLNIDFVLAKFLKVGVSSKLIDSKTQGYNAVGALPLAYMNPLSQPFDSAGKLVNFPSEINSAIFNPLANYYNPYKNTTDNLRANNIIYTNFTIAKGLNLRTNFSLNIGRTSTDVFKGQNSYDQAGRTNYASQGQNNAKDIVLDNILSYVWESGPHSINLTAVSSIQSSTNTSSSGSGEGFPIEDISSYNLNTATANIVVNSFYSKTTIESYLGRAQYAYKDKYILNGTFRTDGSSVLAPGHKWGYFPSVSGAWVISKEDFFKPGMVSNLKLRGSYGTVGNSAIDPYSTIAQASQRPYNFGANTYFGYKLGGIPNPDLKWEYSTTANLGVEVSLFNDRLSGTLELYKTNTKDLLLSRALPNFTGFSTVTQNIGATSNRGLELNLTSLNINKRMFKWNTNLNISVNRSKIEHLITDADQPGDNWFIGQPINIYYNYQKIGIWQSTEQEAAAKYQRTPGDVKIRDVNGDGVVDAVNDRVILGQTDPKFMWFMRNSFDYGDLNLSFALESKLGQMVATSTLGNDVFFDGQRTMPAVIAGNYWTPDNPTNDFPKLGASRPLNSDLTQYRKGGYINMQEITLGYNFKQFKIFKNLQLYARAKNPFYVYREDKNIDPQSPGFDISAFKTYVLGLNVTLK
jgi:TonB-linked SusC/RagA family outer membrane protein